MEQCTDHTQCAERIRAVEESVKSAHHRIEDVQENQKILMDMNANIKLLAERYQVQTDRIGTIEVDVKELKDKPSKSWEMVINTIIVTFVGGAAGAILTLIIK